MRKYWLNIYILFIASFVILIISLLITNFMPTNYKPFSNSSCDQQIYNNIKESYGNHRNTSYKQIYEYVDSIQLSDDMDSCNDLNYIKEINHLSINLHNQDSDILKSVENYPYTIHSLSIFNNSTEKVDIDLKTLNHFKLNFLQLYNVNIINPDKLNEMMQDKDISIILNKVNEFDFVNISNYSGTINLYLNNVENIIASKNYQVNDSTFLSVHIDTPNHISFDNLENLFIYSLNLSDVDENILNELIKLKGINHLYIYNSESFDLTLLNSMEKLNEFSCDTSFVSFGNNEKILDELKQNGCILH